MMGDGQHLHHAADLAVNQVERKNREMQTTDRRSGNQPVPLRRFADNGHDSMEFRVITPAQPRLPIFVISNLFSMFRRRFGV